MTTAQHKAGDRITIETLDEYIEGYLSDDIDDLDGIIPVTLDDGYSDYPGQQRTYHGWMLTNDQICFEGEGVAA